MAELTGIDAAIKEGGLVPGSSVEPDTEQLALELGADVIEQAAEHRNVELAPRRGRPKGAKNRATKDLFDALARMGHKDPLVSASEMVTQGVHNIRSALGCDIDKAIDLWRWAHELVTRYKHSPPPAQIDLGGVPSIPIYFGIAPYEGDTSIKTEACGTPVLDASYEVAQTQGRTDASSV